jgi:hypothetical protein
MSEDGGRDRRTIERAVMMHGTSRSRLEAAQVLAKLVRESRGWGVAYGHADTLASGRLAPVRSDREGGDQRLEDRVGPDSSPELCQELRSRPLITVQSPERRT